MPEARKKSKYEQMLDDDLAAAGAEEQTAAPIGSPTQNRTRYDDMLDEDLREEPTAAAPEADGTPLDLPEPHEGMYDGMEPEDAQALYEAYKRHPQTAKGGRNVVPESRGMASDVYAWMTGGEVEPVQEGVLYKGVEVPAPSQSRENLRRQEDIFQTGVGNAIKSTGGLIAAGIESTVGPEGLTEGYEKMFPQRQTVRPDDQWLADAIGITAGGALGGAGGGAAVARMIAPKAAPLAKGIAQAIFRSGGAAAGTAVTFGDDETDMLVGPNGLMKGIDTSDKDVAQAVLAERANIFLDSLVLAGPVEAVGAGAKALLKFGNDVLVQPIRGLISENARNKLIIKSVIEELTGVTGDVTVDRLREIRNNVYKIFANPENKKAFYKLEGTGLTGDIKFNRDSASVLQEGLERQLADPNLGPDEAMNIKAMIAEIQNMRKGVIQAGGKKTQVALNQPAENLEGALAQGEEYSFGGPQSIEEARLGIQQGAQEQVAAAQRPLDVAEQNLEILETTVPAMGDSQTETALRQGRRPEEYLRERGDATASAVQKLREGGEIAEAEKNRLFADIGRTRGFQMNNESFNKAYEGAKQYLDPELVKTFEATKGTFGEMYTETRDPLVKLINAASKGNREVERKALVALKENLTKDQIKYMKKIIETTGDPTLAQDLSVAVKAVEDTETFFKDSVVYPYRQGITKKLSTAEQKFRQDIPERNVQQKNILQQELQNPQRDAIDHLVEVVNRPELKDSEIQKDLGRIAVGGMVSDIQQAVRSSGGSLADIEPSVVDAAYNKYANLITPEHFPKEYKELAKFRDELVQRKGDKKALQKFIKDQEVKLKEVTEKVYERDFKDFFKDKVPLPRGYSSFDEMLKSPQAADRVQNVIDLAQSSGKPEIEQGLKTALSKSLRNKFFPSDKPADAAINAVLNGQDNSLEYIEKVWGAEGKEAFETMLTDVQKASQGGKVSSAATEGMGFGEKETRGAFQKSANIIWGRLSRRGAQASTVASALVDIWGPSELRNRFMDQIFSDPDAFIEAFQLIKAWPETNEAQKRTAIHWLANAGLRHDTIAEATGLKKDEVEMIELQDMFPKESKNKATRKIKDSGKLAP